MLNLYYMKFALLLVGHIIALRSNILMCYVVNKSLSKWSLKSTYFDITTKYGFLKKSLWKFVKISIKNIAKVFVQNNFIVKQENF